MKKIIFALYSFSELSADVQDKVISRMSDINVDYEWWDYIFDDAKIVGLKITGFDIDRIHISIKFTDDALYTANKIAEGHGEGCATYKFAQGFIEDRDALVEQARYSYAVDNEYEFDKECDSLESDFLQALGEEYLSLLRKNYEYLVSREAIIETIEANEYLFTKDGKRI